MEIVEKKTRKRRRTKIEIENEIWSALERLIIKKGFHNLTIVELAQEAKVEPIVLYNRFYNLEDVIEKYVRRYDYWLKDAIKIDPKVEPKSQLKKIITDLIKELYKNEIMQKILLWELDNSSEVNRQMAEVREIQSKPLYNYFNERLEAVGVGLEPVTSVLIAGVYYLVLHRKISTFGFINFDSKQGKQVLLDTAEEIIEHSFIPKSIPVSYKKPKTATEVAQNMLEIGISAKIIEISTGLTIKEINNLKK